MGVAVLLLLLLMLYVPLTTAMVVIRPQRAQTDILSPAESVQKTEFVPFVDAHKETEFTAFSDSRRTDMINHQPAAPTLLKNSLTKSNSASRSQRSVQKGCQFGTCQVHNLANTLYVMGQSNGKDQSKKAGDPNGYGR
ncbi:hypothetical protein AMEX_G18253 [Astyanax mexicanus]|nr:hypothetical protein AMEX_G18253 [Astyanax mexicanus]